MSDDTNMHAPRRSLTRCIRNARLQRLGKQVYRAYLDLPAWGGGDNDGDGGGGEEGDSGSDGEGGGGDDSGGGDGDGGGGDD